MKPTHLDSHHNAHGPEVAMPIADKLTGKYGLSLRRADNDQTVDELYGSVKRTAFMLRDFYGEKTNFETLEKLLRFVAEKGRPWK